MIRKLVVMVALFSVGVFAWSGSALATGGGECTGGKCGTPKQSGGGGGGGGGSILINNTDTGDTYQYADDYDDDGHEDDTDNCPYVANYSQLDTDGDLIGDACDLCPAVPEKTQVDTDSDGMGDVCDTDIDNDRIPNAKDNCPYVANNFGGKQPDNDNDKIGDACDPDDDNDGVKDAVDNCPLVSNPDQKNSDPNAYGDLCDNDDDKDNILNAKDNCPTVANLDQLDSDGDSIGDSCDSDRDNDGIFNSNDNCPALVNKDQLDGDRDGKGDACDNRYCYVIGEDTENCLDPKMPFTVYSPNAKAVTGQEFRLRLFANRKNTPIRYKWIVMSRPDGSSATVSNPSGSASMSTPYEYHYLKSRRTTITPDEPGDYTIKLVGDLVLKDTVNESFPGQHTHTMSLKVEGDSIGGCSISSGSGRSGGGPATLLLVLLGSLALRRRRRS